MATTMQLVTAIARAKAEILNDVGRAVSSTGETMPLYPRSFSELHDYVDANTYGGMCDDDLFPILWPHGNEIQSALSGWLQDRWNAANPAESDANTDPTVEIVDALPTDFLRDGHTLVVATLLIKDEDLLAYGETVPDLADLSASVQARINAEAGYLDNGLPVMPTATEVAVIHVTPEGGYGR